MVFTSKTDMLVQCFQERRFRGALVEKTIGDRKMNSRRNPVSVNDPGFWELIDNRTSLQIGTLGKYGWPHMASLWFASENGAVILTSYRRTQKVENLRRDRHVTLLWEDDFHGEGLAGASVYGQAELIDASEGPDAMQKVGRYYRMVLTRYASHPSANHPPSCKQIEKLVHENTAKKAAIILRPEKVIVWEHSDLCGVY